MVQRSLAQMIDNGLGEVPLEIVTDPAAVSAYVEERDAENVARLRDCLADDRCFDSALQFRAEYLRAHRQITEPAIRRVLGDSSRSAETRAYAAVNLMAMGDAGAEEVWRRMTTDDDGWTRFYSLEALERVYPEGADARRDVFDQVVRRALAEPGKGYFFSATISNFAASSDTPSLVSRLRELLDETRGETQDDVARLLLQLAPSPEIGRFGMERYRQGEEELSSSAKGDLKTYLLLLEEKERGEYVDWLMGRFQAGDKFLLDVLIKFPDARHRDQYLDIFRNAEDDYDRMRALTALGRIEENATELMLETLGSVRDVRYSGLRDRALSELWRLKAGSGEIELARRILETAGNETAADQHAYVAMAVAGRRVLPAMQALYEERGWRPQLSHEMLWVLNGVTVDGALEAFQAAELVPDGGWELALAYVAESWDWDTRDKPSFFFQVLYGLEAVSSFDAEAGMVPVEHDGLVWDLSSVTRGLLPVSHADQLAEETEDDIGYTVRWKVNDRLYRLRFRDDGDWYALEYLIPALNATARDAGLRERFVGLDTEDQGAMYLFADPDTVERLAEELALPLAGRDIDPISRGKAFEEAARARRPGADVH